jgi:hypothetical protein
LYCRYAVTRSPANDDDSRHIHTIGAAAANPSAYDPNNSSIVLNGIQNGSRPAPFVKKSILRMAGFCHRRLPQILEIGHRWSLLAGDMAKHPGPQPVRQWRFARNAYRRVNSHYAMLEQSMHRLRHHIPHERPILMPQLFDFLPRLLRRGAL